MNSKTFFVLVAWATGWSSIFAAGITGRTWIDTDGNGIQNPGEPGISSVFISLYDQQTNYVMDTASNGQGMYAFTNLNDGAYFISVSTPLAYAITVQDAGSDDGVDSDLNLIGLSPVHTISGATVANIDGGFIKLIPGITLKILSGNSPVGPFLYVTNGAFITFTYVVSNSGNTVLSNINLSDAVDSRYFVACPLILDVGKVSTLTQTVEVVEYTEWTVDVFGFPVYYKTCTSLAGLDPVFTNRMVAIIITTGGEDSDNDGMPNDWESQSGLNPSVSNSPGSNSDSDWMTDLEEFWADTLPTNGESYFPPVALTNAPFGQMSLAIKSSSMDRIYSVRWSTNLLAVPQSWNILPPEKTGTSSALSFTVTNNVPVRFYRTGVRLP